MTAHHSQGPASTRAVFHAPAAAPQHAEPWLTKRQVAVHLGFSTRWVELRMREGMPSRLMGGCRRFRLSEVEGWVDGRQPSTRSRAA
jgi:predicted DNA-binding transcriptional regulator AlpA